MTRVRLEYGDHNDSFATCLPRTGTIAGRFAAESGPDDWFLVQVDVPIEYRLAPGEPSRFGLFETRHLLIRSRWVGREVGQGTETSVFILLVHPSQLPLVSPLRIDEYHHVAWGTCRTLHEPIDGDQANLSQAVGRMPTRRQVLIALVACAAGALAAGGAIAGVIRWWEAHHEVGNYWLLPINNTRFWFLLVLAAAVPVLAWWARRPRAWAAIAFLGMLASAVGSVLFWASRARELPPGVTRAVAIQVAPDQVAVPAMMGALTLFALVALGLGIRDTLREVVRSDP